MKAALALILLLTLFTTTKADYFAGIISDKALSDSTTNAINALKAALIADFDCSDNSRSRQIFPFGGIFNLGGLFGGRKLFGSFFQSIFKRNNDRSVFTFNSPIPKCEFNTFGGNNIKNQLYNKCQTVIGYLAQIKKLVDQYNNVIIGQENTINGNKNFVVGSKDNLNGNNNWVFTSDLNLKTVEDGVLIIGNYLIELTDVPLILKDPSEAIRCITIDDSNQKFRKWWTEAPNRHRTCF